MKTLQSFLTKCLELFSYKNLRIVIYEFIDKLGAVFSGKSGPVRFMVNYMRARNIIHMTIMKDCRLKTF